MDRTSHALLFAALVAGAGHGQDLHGGGADDRSVAGAWVDRTAFPAAGTWPVGASEDLLQTSYTSNSEDSYEAWETLHGIDGAGADIDSDADGIPNGIEFVIGGDPSGADSNALLPTASVDNTDLTFVFRRTDNSAGYNPYVEYGSDLSGWTTAEGGVDGVVITEENNFHGGNTDRVTVVIPRSLAASGELFVRLRIDVL